MHAVADRLSEKKRECVSNSMLARAARRRRPATPRMPPGGARREPPRRRKKNRLRRFGVRFLAYCRKMRGGRAFPREASPADVCWSCVGTLIGMACLAFVNTGLWGRQEHGLLLGSFGASAVLVFGAPSSPFAQPRNVIGGQMLSALTGVLVQQCAGSFPWLAASLAVAAAVAAMRLTDTVHPPGGATALLAVTGSPELKSFGMAFAVYPVGISVLILTAVGVLYNNLYARRHYPLSWW
jgi:CBS-domain-containing membrane protein